MASSCFSRTGFTLLSLRSGVLSRELHTTLGWCPRCPRPRAEPRHVLPFPGPGCRPPEEVSEEADCLCGHSSAQLVVRDSPEAVGWALEPLARLAIGTSSSERTSSASLSSARSAESTRPAILCSFAMRRAAGPATLMSKRRSSASSSEPTSLRSRLRNSGSQANVDCYRDGRGGHLPVLWR